MIDRRDLLRLLSLSALAVTITSLAGCSESEDPGRRPGSPGDVELVAADVPRADGDRAAIPGVVAALHATGGALFGALAATPGNLAISPYSIAVAMALATNGARGTTLDELALLFDGADLEQVNGGLNALTTHVEALAGEREKADGTRTEVVLDAVNALFGQRGLTWEEPFLETLAREYGAGMNTVDYVGDVEAARAVVNAWTAEQTRDKIEEILPPGSVDGLTRLVLVNSLYLKAPWEQPFEKDLTADADFTLLDGTVTQVATMRTAEPIAGGFGRGDGWQAVRLPYAGGAVAMSVVLPDAGRYDEIEADLVAGSLPTYLAALRPDQVAVTLPSWTFRTQAPLKEPLRGLGIEVPFDSVLADFSAMTTDTDLSITAVLHEVFIAVDEEGTEAAAATAVVVGTTSAPAPGTTFVADRPFLFVIHDVEHATPLFLGRVVDPS